MTEPTSGWLEGREHVLPVRIYYEDTDFTGVVYHGNYLRYFERGRSDFLRLLDVGHHALLSAEDPSAFTVARIAVDYRRPARIDDALVVRTRFERMQGPRLHVRQRIFRGADLLAEAEVEVASIRPDGRPRKPPKGLLAALQPVLA